MIQIGSSHKVNWHIAAPADRAVFAFKHGITRHGWHIYKEEGNKIVVGPHAGISRLFVTLFESYPDRIHVDILIRGTSRSELAFECKFQRAGFKDQTIRENAWKKTMEICKTLSLTAKELGIPSSWTASDLQGLIDMVADLKHGGPLDFSRSNRPFDPEAF